MPKSKLPKVSLLVGEIYEIEFSPEQRRELVRAAVVTEECDLAHHIAAFALLGARVYAERCARTQELERKAKKAKGKKA